MDLIIKNAGAASSVKESNRSKSKAASDFPKLAENVNPNVTTQSPRKKAGGSPVVKSAKALKSASKIQNLVVNSPKYKIRERKFVVAKKIGKKENADVGGTNVECKCKEKADGNNIKKCLCVAYETLRASQEEFLKNRDAGGENTGESDQFSGCGGSVAAADELEEEIEKKLLAQDLQIEVGFHGTVEEGDYSNRMMALNEFNYQRPQECESPNHVGGSTIKRRRERLMEEARNSVPESGSGRVMHLVKAFEKLLSMPSSKDLEKKDENQPAESYKKKVIKWALPGLQPHKEDETQVSLSSFCPSELFLTSENLGLDRRSSVSSSLDGSRGSISSRTSNGSRRSRRNSTESSANTDSRRWNKKKHRRVTSQKPFRLRTEQRGKAKEEEFVKKVQEKMIEEEKQRIPIAQGLPWTTDEPECLIKPPVKECTRPLDLTLHSDVRAVERAEFDYQVAEKMNLIEQYKMERERLQKMEEEEELKRLRKEQVPKAQPMPYFDRPFIPRRSMKLPTIPREPKFHIPQHKKIKSCMSWNELNSAFSFQS